jgi:amphi-Trp domain-containing protein
MTKKLKYTELRSLDSAILQLQEVVDGLRAGVLRLRRGEQQMQLKPGGVLDFALHAERKGARERFEFGLEWRRQDLASSAEDGSIESEPESSSPESLSVSLASVSSASVSSASVSAGAQAAVEAENDRSFEEDSEPVSADDDDALASDMDEPRTLRPSMTVMSSAVAVQAPDEIDDEAVTLRQSSPPGGQRSASKGGPRSDAEWFERLYRESRTLVGDERPRLDEKRFADSLAGAGLEPQLQQELCNLARQADAEGRDRLFQAHSISDLISSTLTGAA